MNLEPITNICRTRWNTGAYARTKFALTPDDFQRIQELPEPPAQSHPGNIDGLLGIPVVLDPGLGPGHWRLVDHDGEILYAGNLNQETTP